MIHPPIDVTDTDWLIIQAILRVHVPDYTVWTFGSRATGNAKKFSDLDLAIIGEQPMGLNLSSRLAEAFSESNLPYKVDLVDWATTSEAFKQIIERDKVVVQQGLA
ncbi:MAG: nucleotidyltransferase domain-containing protein [Nitrosomonas sp.]|nr:nucleotidyltransferase domain-containing protein [Nitrosomonas sp.]